MWTYTYLLGPFLAFLPRRWRKALPFHDSVNWGPAATISGLAEFVVAVAALMYWYSYSMDTWVQRGLDFAMSGKAGSGEVTDHAIGGMAYLIWATSPLTWALGYVFLEGAVRLCGGAFTGNILGTLPLFLLDKVFVKIFRGDPPDAVRANAPPGSFASAIHEKVLSGLPKTSDELQIRNDGTEEILEIRASRKKPDWTPPRVVRFQDAYYRLEAYSKGGAPRPFRYTLRRLPTGVPGRSVLVYQPE